TLAGSRDYDGSTDFGPGSFGTINGVNGETLTVASGTGTVPSPKVLAGTQSLATGSLALGNGTGLASNYTLVGGTHTGTISATALVPFAWDPSGGDLRWENPANWNQGAVPMNGATASILGGLSGPVVYSSVSGATSLKTLSSASGFTITGGTLTLGNSTADISSFSGAPLTVSGGLLNGPGTINLVGTTLDVLAGGVLGGSRTIVGDVNNLSGTVSPGASPGIMTIDGDYFQGSSATLLAEIGGTATGQYDQLIVTGTVTLGGNLTVVLDNGFFPLAGDTFTIVQGGGAVSGAFASTSLPAALPMRTDQLASSVSVTADPLVNTEQLISTQVNQANNAPPSVDVTQGTSNANIPGGLVVGNTYLETGSGQVVALSQTGTVQSGVYTNVATGQTTILGSGSLPDPGIYLSADGATVLVITLDSETGQPVILTGSTGESGDTVGSQAKVSKPGVCK
ncbi:MAG: hypothetical protein OEW79_09285, partial [Betaproteobacteria bacterium]|nr:hypothetical protein [Betaproteobacteria bacterium]